MRVLLSWLAEYVDLPAWRSTPTSSARPSCASASRSRRSTPGAGRSPARWWSAGCSTIEELTELKKPIRWCQVDVGEARARAASSAAPPTSPSATSWSSRCPGAVLPGRLRDRRAQDLRARLRRHDLLGARARHRRRPRRHPRAAAGHRRAGRRRARRCSAATTGDRARHHAGPRLRVLRARAGPRDRHATDVRLRRPGEPRRRAGRRGRRHGRSRSPTDGLPALRRPPRRPASTRRRASPWWMQRRLLGGRDAADLAGRRRHQLRDARARPAAARLRPRAADRADRRAPGAAGREAHHPRRRRAPPRPRRPAHHRRLRPDRRSPA